MTQVSAPTTFVNNAAYTIVGAAGIQQTMAIPLLHNDDVKSLFSTMPTTVAFVGYGPRRMVIDSCVSETTFTNTSTAPLELVLYHISAKKDIPLTWSYVQGANTYSLGPNPSDYWQEGLNIAAGSTPGFSIQYQTPGSYPTDSQFFKDYFKIEKRITVLIPQGGSHRAVLTYACNTLVKEDEIGQASSFRPNVGVKRLVRWIMATCTGLPCVDATAAAPFPTTLASAGISAVQTNRYRYQFVSDFTASAISVNNLPQPLAPQQKVINIGTGTFVAPDGNIV